ncbi:MAG: hypothetical protein ACERKD_19310 [Prolixibacteraceae bacterium]
MKEILIRRVTGLADLRKVYGLAYETYMRTGLVNTTTDDLMIHHPAQDVVPQTHIFVAEEGTKMVGTLTFSIDNQFGLMVDEDFKKEVDVYRELFPKIAAVWRFAILPEHQSDSRIMKKLIAVVASCLDVFNVSICFFTLSPDHARIYERAMNMEEVCRGKDMNPLIKEEHQEVVLMKLYTEKIPKRWQLKTRVEAFV